jgi:hypothetical protein
MTVRIKDGHIFWNGTPIEEVPTDDFYHATLEVLDDLLESIETINRLRAARRSQSQDTPSSEAPQPTS